MRHVGRHLIAELFGCHPERLNDLNAVRYGLMEAAGHAKETDMTGAFHQFAPVGISGVLVNGDAHLSIHTWPEYRYAALDIFSCGDGPEADQAIIHLIRHFEAESVSLIALHRGQSITGWKPSNGAREPLTGTGGPLEAQERAVLLQRSGPGLACFADRAGGTA